MEYLYIIMMVLLIISVIFDREKTWKAIRRGIKKLLKILPNYLKILVLLALLLGVTDRLRKTLSVIVVAGVIL